MSIEKSDLNGAEYELKLDDGGVLARRKMERLTGGLHFFEDDFEIKGLLAANIITCRGWLLEFVDLEAGEAFFQRGREVFQPKTNRFGIFYPPFTFTRLNFRAASGRFTGLAGNETLKVRFFDPVVFQAGGIPAPKTVAEAARILDSIEAYDEIDANPKASLISLKARKIINECYQIYPSIARIAARLNISHEHLTRQFKADYGLSPNKYLHQLRIADATFRLSQGEEIARVSGEVGYNDLSRFYKQFRRSTTRSPKYCQDKSASKNAKTLS